MMAILWGRMPYLTPLLNTEIIPPEQAPEAKKFPRRFAEEVRRRSAQNDEGGDVIAGHVHQSGSRA
jgi:hypothetical protein